MYQKDSPLQAAKLFEHQCGHEVTIISDITVHTDRYLKPNKSYRMITDVKQTKQVCFHIWYC